MSKLRNQPLFEDSRLGGWEYCQAHAAAADEWLASLFADAVATVGGGSSKGLALVALGGYGRGRLWPQSDLDVLLLHANRTDISEVADAIWYPVWDRNIKLGHSVMTPKEAAALAGQELERSTAFQRMRLIAGDASLLGTTERLLDKAWAKSGDQLLDQLVVVVEERHRQFGDVAFRLEPDLKESRGGLRDLDALTWAERAHPGFAADLIRDLESEWELLAAARVALHRVTNRAGNRLGLDEQDEVAELMGWNNGQELMLNLALAGRTVAWNSDEAWDRWKRLGARRLGFKRAGRPQVLTTQFELRAKHLELREGVSVDADPLIVLRAAEYAARKGHTIGRKTLRLLASQAKPIPEPWPPEARDLFAGIFMAGSPAIHIVEDLDHFGLMTYLLPEWEAVRCKPQRNVMHTFTVDRHLCEAAANASQLTESVSRPDLLVVGTLLHDIGKGFPGDHTEVGMEIIKTIATRMGYAADETAVLIDLCRHHLLLPDVATRRDLTDPGTIRAVAATVDTVEFAEMLAALTEADSLSTGPSAWGAWKANLVRELVDRTAHVLEGGELAELTLDFPTPDVTEAMAEGSRQISGKGTVLTVVSNDTPGLFGRIAGVLTVFGLDVLEAAAFSDDYGMAANRFVVQAGSNDEIEWDRVTGLVADALDGRVALTARVAKRAREQEAFRRRLSATPPRRQVNVDNQISDTATVVDVHAPDSVGLLFRVTQALAEFHLDIRRAKVQTLGPEAVDSFYLTDPAGFKLDESLLPEIKVALHEAMGVEE